MIRAILIPLAVVAALGACEGRAARATPERHVVEIRGFQFLPATIEVEPGDTVVWVNQDMVPHTATAAVGGWDSGVIAAGASWSRVVGEGDAGDYACALHPTMKGTVNFE